MLKSFIGKYRIICVWRANFPCHMTRNSSWLGQQTCNLSIDITRFLYLLKIILNKRQAFVEGLFPTWQMQPLKTTIFVTYVSEVCGHLKDDKISKRFPTIIKLGKSSKIFNDWVASVIQLSTGTFITQRQRFLWLLSSLLTTKKYSMKFVPAHLVNNYC